MDKLLEKKLLASLGSALMYPDEAFQSHLDEALALSEEVEVKEQILKFLELRKGYTHTRLAEIYTRTFDVAPACIPYLSIHLFGEESFHRARLMVGMRTSLLDVGIDPAPELPDHFAIVLRAAPLLADEEWDELVGFVFRAAMHAMIVSIEQTENLYVHLLRAVQLIVGEPTAEDIQRLNVAKRSAKDCTPPGLKESQSCGGGC